MFDSSDHEMFCSNELDELVDDGLRILMAVFFFAAGYKVVVGLINGVTHWDDFIVVGLALYMFTSAGIRWFQEKTW